MGECYLLMWKDVGSNLGLSMFMDILTKKERTALFQTLQPFLCSRRNIVMRGLIVPSKKELDGVRTLWIEGMGAPVC